MWNLPTFEQLKYIFLFDIILLQHMTAVKIFSKKKKKKKILKTWYEAGRIKASSGCKFSKLKLCSKILNHVKVSSMPHCTCSYEIQLVCKFPVCGIAHAGNCKNTSSFVWLTYFEWNELTAVVNLLQEVVMPENGIFKFARSRWTF